MCAFVCFYVRSSVQLKIHAANIEASKFVCLVGDEDFPNASSMYMRLLQLLYISLFCLVARNTILLQKDVMWIGKI